MRQDTQISICLDNEEGIQEELKCSVLSQDLQWRAEQELQEKPQWRQRDVQALRDILKEDRSLRCRLDDEFLLMFLRARKFDYDRAACLVQQYYLIRKNHPKLFFNLKPSALAPIFNHQLQTLLPHKDPQGRSIFVFRPGLWDPSTISVDDIFRSNVICLEHCIRSVETQVCGLVALLDLSGFSFHHVRNFTAKDAKKMMSVIQDCFPVRFAAFHFINHPWLFNIAFNLVKPFLSEKLRSRMYFHGYCLDYLHEHIPPDILPQEYGGTQPLFDNAPFFNQLVKEDSYYEDMTTYGYVSEDMVCRTMDDNDSLLGSYYSLCTYRQSAQEE